MTDNIIGEMSAYTFNSEYSSTALEESYNRATAAVQEDLRQEIDARQLDEVGIWNRILTADEIATLRDNGIFYDYTPEAKIANWKEHMTR